MEKYQVGDLVKVKKNLKLGKIYGVDMFTLGMAPTRGRIFKIGLVYRTSYRLEGSTGYWYTPEMLKPVLTSEFKAFKKLLKKIKPVEYNGQERAYIGQRVDGFHVFTSCYRVAPLRFNTAAEAHQFITDNAELLEKAKNLI